MIGKPWGLLTGVRPTKKARNLLENGVGEEDLEKILRKEYKIKKKKVNLLLETLNNQEIVKDDLVVDFYVNIPICPTRCAYCSFISAEISCVRNILPNYLNTLIYEINEAKKLIKERSLIVRSVYIGGGTPSVLESEELEKVLSQLNFGDVEFTVECGRPDTITPEKLKVLKKFGVTRISINPQTFCAKTLEKIGRKHTIEQVYDAFECARENNLLVNMDLIAGLEGESFQIFKQSLLEAIRLKPENITIHTLSIKRGSSLQGQKVQNKQVSKMLSWGYKILSKNGYAPYYLYRQKNQLGNLENIGYALMGTQCIFNVDSMEETVSILACGANATSKFVSHTEGKIARHHNPKFLQDYIQRIDEVVEKKKQLFNQKPR